MLFLRDMAGNLPSVLGETVFTYYHNEHVVGKAGLQACRLSGSPPEHCHAVGHNSLLFYVHPASWDPVRQTRFKHFHQGGFAALGRTDSPPAWEVGQPAKSLPARELEPTCRCSAHTLCTEFMEVSAALCAYPHCQGCSLRLP